MIVKYWPPSALAAPAKLRLVAPAPGVFRIVRVASSVQSYAPGGNSRGSLKTTPEVKARLVSRASHGHGYRPSLLQAAKDEAERLPVEPAAVLEWLVPPESAGRLHGLSDIVAPMSGGVWSADYADQAEAEGTDAPSTGADHLRPKSGAVKDLHVNAHGFRVFAGDDPRFPCCRVCGAPIRTESVAAVCDFSCQGCSLVPEDDSRDMGDSVRLCEQGCSPDMNHDKCGCNAHRLAFQKQNKPRVTCSPGCFRIYDSRRHRVFRPEPALTERVRELRTLDDLTIARILGVSQKRVRKILANLPEYAL